VHYAFKSTTSEDEWTEVEKTEDKSKKCQDEIKALTAQLKEYTTAYTARWSGPNEVKSDKKYAWKRIPPKDDDPVTRREHVNGISKTYYWCPYHLQWTIHLPKECKRLPTGKGKSKSTDKKAIKRSQFKERKKAYIHAKAAYEALMSTSTDSDEETSNSDNDEGSNKSVSSYSSEDSNIS
jgi:chaperonin cofactor prefoldin